MPLVWAIVVLVGFFTAAKIADDMNSTADEQAELVNATSDFCKKNNLSPADCKAMLQQQTQAITDSNDSGIFGSVIKYGLILAAVYAGYKIIAPKFQSKTQPAHG